MKRRKGKRGLIMFFLFSCFLVLVFFGIVFWAPQGFGEEKNFTVKRGQGLKEISWNLKEAGIIRSRLAFEIFVLLKEVQGKLKEGSFALSNKMSVAKIVEMLSKGGEAVKVTIPEGYTVEQIFQTLEEQRIVKKKDLEKFTPADFSEYPFLKEKKSFEGFLFPETHFFLVQTAPRDVLKTYLEEFSKQALPRLSAPEVTHPFYEILIMASLIEAEVPNEEDRALISGILWKRLESGMPLQVDSSLNYMTGKRKRSLDAEELKIDSPYNTYLYPDLPPTPIGNPGLSAIRAALYPKESSYWFFLSGNDGKTHFATTFEEHKLNKARYLR